MSLYSDKIGSLLDEASSVRIASVDEFIRSNDNFILFGASLGGIDVKEALERMGKSVSFFADNDPKKQGTKVEELIVKNPRCLKGEVHHKIIISSIWFLEIAEQLEQEFGLKFMEDFTIYFGLELANRSQIGEEFFRFLKERRGSFNEVFDILSDADSQEMFLKVLRYRLLFFQYGKVDKNYLVAEDKDCSHYAQSPEDCLDVPKGIASRESFLGHYSSEAYRYKDLVVPRKSDIVIDAGGTCGDTAFQFHKDVTDTGRVYVFEPASSFYKILSQNIKICKLEHIVFPFELALSDREGYSKFCEIKETGLSCLDEAGELEVEVITIDKFVKRMRIPRVDFIKMDIEGAELEALRGAKEQIQASKPDLAICLYHRPEHLYKIPLYLKSLVPEYRIYIKHYSITTSGTICFATIR